MLCPADGTNLTVRDVGPHIGYGCAVCQCAWLPRHYLESLRYTYAFSIEEFFAELARARTGESATLSCPMGGGRLSEVRRDDRVVLWCEHCQGVWLKRGDMAALVAKLERLEPGSAPGDYGKVLAFDVAVSTVIAVFLSL